MLEITGIFLIPHINKESKKNGEKKAIVICRNSGECEKFRFVKPQISRIIFVQNVHFNFGKMMLLWSQVTEAYRYAFGTLLDSPQDSRSARIHC